MLISDREWLSPGSLRVADSSLVACMLIALVGVFSPMDEKGVEPASPADGGVESLALLLEGVEDLVNLPLT